MRCSRLLFLLACGFVLVSLPAWALMPPHVTGTNVKNGVLQGTTLIVRGYSLEYTVVPKELSLTHEEGRRPVQFEHRTECENEGDCSGDAPLGACQSRCELTLKLSDLKDGESLKLNYLDVGFSFKVKLIK